MYHDQGHIAIKVHNWEKSISVNLGLPFIRTSVDHGTAFDIAGKGIADYQSMLEAIRVAVDLAGGQGLNQVTREMNGPSSHPPALRCWGKSPTLSERVEPSLNSPPGTSNKV